MNYLITGYVWDDGKTARYVNDTYQDYDSANEAFKALVIAWDHNTITLKVWG